jgi:hypothetical protein
MRGGLCHYEEALFPCPEQVQPAEMVGRTTASLTLGLALDAKNSNLPTDGAKRISATGHKRATPPRLNSIFVHFGPKADKPEHAWIVRFILSGVTSFSAVFARILAPHRKCLS